MKWEIISKSIESDYKEAKEVEIIILKKTLKNNETILLFRY